MMELMVLYIHMDLLHYQNQQGPDTLLAHGANRSIRGGQRYY